MKNFINSVVITLALIVILFIAATFISSHAKANDLLTVDTLDVVHYSYGSGSQDPLVTQNIPNKALNSYLGLEMHNSVLYYFYTDWTIHSDTDRDIVTNDSQFRTVGLQLKLGFNLSNTIALEYMHHSQHVLDTPYKDHFPVEDAIGIRIRLISNKFRDSIF